MTKTKIYSAIFIEDKHITIDFNPGKCILPEGVKNGDKVSVLVYGKYNDNEGYEALIVGIKIGYKLLTEQPSGLGEGTILHITTQIPEGGSPVETGKRSTANGWDPITPYWIEGEAGFFEA